MSAPQERWLGATGRRVPQIALEGSLDLGEALVLDALPADPGALRAAFARGTPVAIRAATEDDVKRALARPEVSCVLVRDRSLLELDLAELTYG